MEEISTALENSAFIDIEESGGTVRITFQPPVEGQHEPEQKTLVISGATAGDCTIE